MEVDHHIYLGQSHSARTMTNCVRRQEASSPPSVTTGSGDIARFSATVTLFLLTSAKRTYMEKVTKILQAIVHQLISLTTRQQLNIRFLARGHNQAVFILDPCVVYNN